ncbi:uncharacterized protein B0H64DRAFT_379766 [Chaetomium fimeti]|uniref:Secreted protein n=1 Tax=Chaetomium fimeti TaxID=1854472 RepID=A0AAE0HPI7_9PEZI|nr:hypothetical protein B0H64DRAFT_379766 [Chaetomium fimeti]
MTSRPLFVRFQSMAVLLFLVSSDLIQTFYQDREPRPAYSQLHPVTGTLCLSPVSTLLSHMANKINLNIQFVSAFN